MLNRWDNLRQNISNQNMRDIGVFPKWNRNSLKPANSGNLINNGSMNWAQFKDPVSHMCLTGTVVSSWSVTHEEAGWQVQAILL